MKGIAGRQLEVDPTKDIAIGMRTRILTIVYAGITIGFLLGMGVIALLRAMWDGDGTGLEVTFTMFVGLMAASLVWYVVKTMR